MSSSRLEPSIGEVVRSWREVRGLTPSQLAQRANVAQPYISQLEHGKIKRPGDDILERLAAGLDVPLIDLLLRKLPGPHATADAAGNRQSYPQAAAPGAGVSPTFGDLDVGIRDLRDAGRTRLGLAIDEAVRREGLDPAEQDEVALLLLPHARQLFKYVRARRNRRDLMTTRERDSMTSAPESDEKLTHRLEDTSISYLGSGLQKPSQGKSDLDSRRIS